LSRKLISQKLASLDPTIAGLIEREDQRQADKLVMIASESITPNAVREAVESSLMSIYAEGYPHPRMSSSGEGRLEDSEYWLGHYRRYSGKRFYKGVEFADFVESLAIRRTALAFAPPDIDPEELCVNVQALSGAAANNAVYEAFLVPGDKVMGMVLAGGGHLTHGSPVNRSGKRYEIVSYEMDSKSGQLDYQKMKEMAAIEKPRLLIAGFSAYPWSVDWRKMREVADAAGPDCILLADVAHTAGLIAGGCYPNPVGIVDVTSFTTHKTLCGPRAAVIITTDPEKARLIDNAVFPGEQGGPHINAISGIAVAMKTASSQAFRNSMAAVIDNAAALAAGLESRGLKLAYGGSDTHMLLVDLKGLTRRGEDPISGEIVSRVLDLVGIVCNKNTVIGDENAYHPSAVRLGTTWITQRGLDRADMDVLAGIISDVIKALVPFHYVGTKNPIGRAKLDRNVLADARCRVDKLVAKCVRHPQVKSSKVASGDFIELQGERASLMLQEAGSANILSLAPGKSLISKFIGPDGVPLAVACVHNCGGDRWLLAAGEEIGELYEYLQDLSDGYIFFDSNQDIFSKIAGPVRVLRVEDKALAGLSKTAMASLRDALKNAPLIEEAAVALEKPYFAGINRLRSEAGSAPERRDYSWTAEELELRRTCLYAEHKKITGARMVPFAGWEMPVWYSSIAEEHLAVRSSCGIFDVSHMGVLDVRGAGACRFLDLLCTNYVPAIEPGTAAYSYLLGSDGLAIDDILVYCLGHEHYMVIVNAANAEEDLAWFKAVSQNPGRYKLDNLDPWVQPDALAEVRDMKELEFGDKRRVDLALQGPESLEVLVALAESSRDRRKLMTLAKSQLATVKIAGHSTYVARTGYTGEAMGFELYVHPDHAVDIWQACLEKGVTPCGLGARDSLRTEAGFPLYGQEISGPLGISPAGAGYGAFVKLHKPFFAGRTSLLAAEENRDSEIVRFKILESGSRVIHPGDPVASSRGEFVGQVTSCAFCPDVNGGEPQQVGLAWVKSKAAREGTRLALYPLPRGKRGAPAESPRDQVQAGDKTVLPEYAEILPRFRSPEDQPSEGE
jgi:glycine hydroxymethyltransferase